LQSCFPSAGSPTLLAPTASTQHFVLRKASCLRCLALLQAMIPSCRLRGTCRPLSCHCNLGASDSSRRLTRSLAVLPDGRLASGSHDNTVCVWDVRSGSCAPDAERAHQLGVGSSPFFPTVGSCHWSRRSCSALEADNVPMQAAGRVKALRLFDARVDEEAHRSYVSHLVPRRRGVWITMICFVRSGSGMSTF
jgi:WD40 repeat protein